MSKNWFSANARNSTTAEIAIYSDIGNFGVTASDFRESLLALGNPRELQIRISSNGGDVSQGFAIFNMLARHPARKVVTVDGLAASMASVIAMVGDEIVMPSNAMLMIHNPWGATMGQSEEIISFGEALGKMREAIVAAYAKRSGMKEKDVQTLMDWETWLDAEDAVSLGFADRVEEPMRMVAAIDVSRFDRVPLNFRRQMSDAPSPRTPDDLHAAAWQNFNRRHDETPAIPRAKKLPPLRGNLNSVDVYARWNARREMKPEDSPSAPKARAKFEDRVRRIRDGANK